MTYDEARAKQNELWDAVKTASGVLKGFPKLSNGLTPDRIKFSAEYRAAKATYDAAFRRLRDFNARFHKAFGKTK